MAEEKNKENISKEDTSKEITLIEGPRKLMLADPELKMKFAEKAAKVIMEKAKELGGIIEIPIKNKKGEVIKTEKYISFPIWQMLGAFFGLSVGIDYFLPIEDPVSKKVIGYKVKANVYLRDGSVVGSAWGIATATEKGKENFTPTKLLNTAQTRACARALRQVLGWVAMLGGFKPIPIEEIEEEEENNKGQNQ